MGSIINSALDIVGIGPGSALKKGSKKAAKIAAEGSAQAQSIADKQYQAQQNYLNPYAQMGNAALARQSNLLGLSGNKNAAGYGTYGPGSQFAMTNLAQDPGYAFRLSEGQKALDRQAASRGGLISGGALKAAQRYGQGLASQEYENAYQRYMDRYNVLGGAVTGGYNASNRLADFAGTYGVNKANLYTGNAATQGNAAIQQGKINADIVGGFGAALDQGLSMFGASSQPAPSASVNNLGSQYLPSGGFDPSTSFGKSQYTF